MKSSRPAAEQHVSLQMKESPFRFEYSWEDLRPVHPLVITVIVAQLLGGAIGLSISHFPSWPENLCLGAMIGTFPGFLLGLPIQRSLSPNSISSNRVMVQRMGLVSLFLTLVGLSIRYLFYAG